MRLGPMIDISKPDPLSDILRSVGGGLAKGLGQSQENQMLQQAMSGVNMNDPREIMAMMQRANPILRPQILAMLKQQHEAANIPLDYNRAARRDIREEKQFEQQQKLGELNIQEAQQRQVQADVNRDKQFTDLVGTKLEKLDDLGKSAFIDMSKKYADELNPEVRYQKTLKDYTLQTERVNKIGERIKKIGDFRKSYVGLKQGDLNTISDDVKNAIDSGVDPRVVENVIKTSGLNANDTEAVMSTNFSKVKQILDGLKAPSRKQVPGMPGVVGVMQSLTEKDISQSVNTVSKAIQVGGSLDYIYSGLIEKGYKPIDAQNIVRQAAIGAKLTERQQLQLSNLEASRQSLLGKIFGEVYEQTGV